MFFITVVYICKRREFVKILWQGYYNYDLNKKINSFLIYFNFE